MCKLPSVEGVMNHLCTSQHYFEMLEWPVITRLVRVVVIIFIPSITKQQHVTNKWSSGDNIIVATPWKPFGACGSIVQAGLSSNTSIIIFCCQEFHLCIIRFTFLNIKECHYIHHLSDDKKNIRWPLELLHTAICRHRWEEAFRLLPCVITQMAPNVSVELLWRVCCTYFGVCHIMLPFFFLCILGA